jgi:hypothetical protein
MSDTPLVLGIGYLAVLILLIIGWVMNLVTIWNATEIGVKFVVRCIGVFVLPLGGVLGWF